MKRPDTERPVAALSRPHPRPFCDSVAAVKAKDEQGFTWPDGSGAWTTDDVPDEGRYSSRSLLGQGGMGRVHLAWDPRLRREVALKRPKGGASDPMSARLIREARVAAALEHPGIVRVYDAGEEPDGTPWYTMELIRGRSLRDLLDHPASDEGRIAYLPALIAACEAVAYAHQAGVVHRDLKPDNVMIGTFGQVQIVDWGLARPMDSERGWTQILSGMEETAEGTFLGTPGYMSPEQIEGGEVGPSADVWALGLLLYEVIGGERAFSAPSSREVLAQVLAGPPRSLAALAPDADPELHGIVDRCLRREPRERFTRRRRAVVPPCAPGR